MNSDSPINPGSASQNPAPRGRGGGYRGSRGLNFVVGSNDKHSHTYTRPQGPRPQGQSSRAAAIFGDAAAKIPAIPDVRRHIRGRANSAIAMASASSASAASQGTPATASAVAPSVHGHGAHPAGAGSYRGGHSRRGGHGANRGAGHASGYRGRTGGSQSQGQGSRFSHPRRGAHHGAHTHAGIGAGSARPNPNFARISPDKSLVTDAPDADVAPTAARRAGHKAYDRRPASKLNITKDSNDIVPALGAGNIRIIPIGGVEEIGRNMTIIEMGDDIIVMDAGFQFKDDNTPGVDYILPNTSYLEERKHKIKALIITHGHLDHIGGLPYVIDRIGNPPIYTRNLTAIMIQKRQTEFPHLPALNIRTIEKSEAVKIGALTVEFFSVTHTIPDSMGIIIKTPYGNIVNPGDFKLEHENGVPSERETEGYKRFANEKTLFLMADSTNIENPGFSTPEKEVHKGLEAIIKAIKGRLIIGTFSSQLERLIKIINIAEQYNKKIIVEGRSMKTNIEIATTAGLLTVRKDTIIEASDCDKYPPDRIVILSTGAQGEEFAALMRMATKSHKHLRLTNRDTVVLSSSIIPGNEKTVEKLKDNIARHGAKIVHYRTSELYIHSTAHGNRGEIEWLHRTIKPQFFMPVHGNHYRIRLHAELAMSLGMPEANVAIADDGSIIEIQDGGTKLVKLKEKAAASPMMVDGFSIGNVQEVVLRDRQALATDGMFIIFAIVNTTTGKLKKSPDLISRGFVYLRESGDLLSETRHTIKKTIEDSVAGMNPINFDYVKDAVTDAVSRILFQRTAKRPIVIPVLVGI